MQAKGSPVEFCGVWCKPKAGRHFARESIGNKETRTSRFASDVSRLNTDKQTQLCTCERQRLRLKLFQHLVNRILVKLQQSRRHRCAKAVW